MPPTVVRRQLFATAWLQVGLVVARPSDDGPGAAECQASTVVVLPRRGLFAKHETSRRHVVGTAAHAVLLVKDEPYRIAYPGRVGDECLTLRVTPAGAAQLSADVAPPEDAARPAYGPQVLLDPAAILARERLWRRLAPARRADAGAADPLALEEAASSLLVDILAALRRERARRPLVLPSAPRMARAVARVQEAVAAAPARRWTVAELAAIGGLSPFHLSRGFRRAVGSSVYGYVLRARLARAASLLVDDRHDLSAVALAAGFSSHSHFTARFRAFYGCAPAEARRNLIAAVRPPPLG